jgi:hypothetical protein
MNDYAKAAVVAVAVIAVGLIGFNVLGSAGNGVGAQPTASPSVAPSDAPSAMPGGQVAPPPLTGQFTSATHGFAISYPETWTTRPASTPWTGGFVDYMNPSGDVISQPTDPGDLWLAIASQPLGRRTPATFEDDVWQYLVDDDPNASGCSSATSPVTIDGATGVIGCETAVVTDGGRGYYVRLYTGGDDPSLGEVYDDAWFRSVLATMDLQPGDAAPPPELATDLDGEFTSASHGLSIRYPETWELRPASTAWTGGYVDWFSESGDLLHDPNRPGDAFLALASQPLAGRTALAFEADVWQSLIADDEAFASAAANAQPITIGGHQGVVAGQVALVTAGDRGYLIMLYTGGDDPRVDLEYDEAWFRSVLDTIELHPEDAVDLVASPAPS